MLFLFISYSLYGFLGHDKEGTMPDQHASRSKSTMMVVLTVSDEKKAAQFYEQAFGFENDYKPGGGNWPQGCPPPLHKNDASILLVQAKFSSGPNLATKMLPVPANNAKEMGILPMSLYLRVDNVDKVVSDAIKHGATSTGPVTEMLWGDRCGTVIDPDGYTWMLATHVHTPTKREINQKFKALLKGGKLSS